jgi:glycerophosphoryl diester phosphodiesterase
MPVDELLARPFAHRGLHTDTCPENSLAAFEAAIDGGFGIELDVRLSADGAPVVFHDADLARGCGIDARVSALRAHELCRLQLGSSSETIPTLVSAMHAIGGRTPVLVDLKASVSQRARLADAAAILLRAYPGPVGVVGVDPWLLGAMRRRAPRLLRGQTCAVETWSPRLSAPDFITFNIDRIPAAVVQKIRRRMPAVAWTVRTAAGYRLARAIADGVIVEGDAVAAAAGDASENHVFDHFAVELPVG